MIIMLVVSSLAVATAVFGIVVINHLAGTANKVLDEYIPSSRCSEQALLAVSQGSVCLHQGRLVREPKRSQEIRDIEIRFRRSMVRFDMFINAMKWGSESEAFKRSYKGLTYGTWRLEKWNEMMVVPKAPHSVRQIAGMADIYYAGFTNHATAVIRCQRHLLRLRLAEESGEADEQEREIEEHLRQANRFEGLVNGSLEHTVTNIHAHLADTARNVGRTRRCRESEGSCHRLRVLHDEHSVVEHFFA